MLRILLLHLLLYNFHFFSKPPLQHVKHMLSKYSNFFHLLKTNPLVLVLFSSSPLINIFSFCNIFPQIYFKGYLHLFLSIRSMKFGKRLKHQIQETSPGWRDKFLSYKDLKKLVKLISSASTIMSGSLEYGKAEAEFVYLLNNEIDKFNAFFMEQEEDFIIRHKELQQRIGRVIDTWGPNGSQPFETDYKEEMANIRKDIVDFHGEMVLLMNYSNINYTGLAKILKKYDKRTGGLLRLPYIQKVLDQPFFTTDLISKLVKECESTIDSVFPLCEVVRTVTGEREAITVAGEGIFRKTVAALLTMQEIRKGSSTYGRFSLPPLILPESDNVIQSLQLNSPIAIP